MFSLAKSVASNGRVFWAWLFLIVGAVSFMGFFYAAVISKLQPPSHNIIIRAIQNDCVFPLVKHEVVQARLILRSVASLSNHRGRAVGVSVSFIIMTCNDAHGSLGASSTHSHGTRCIRRVFNDGDCDSTFDCIIHGRCCKLNQAMFLLGLLVNCLFQYTFTASSYIVAE